MAMTEEVLNWQSPLVGIIDSLATFVADLDTGTFSGSDAARLTELFARAEKLCSAGLAMAARRASECSAPERAGARSPGEWLAGISGTDLRSAQATLTTAEQMATAPELEDACRKGELSTDQAAEIADATKSDPSSTGRLIHQAKNRTLKGLKEDCRAVRHQARSRQDDQTRLAAMHRNRYFRTWIDRDGTGRGSFSMTPDRLARFRAWMRPYHKAAFDRSRREGIREEPDRYALDALLDMAEAASQWGAGFPYAPPTADDRESDCDLTEPTIFAPDSGDAPDLLTDSLSGALPDAPVSANSTSAASEAVSDPDRRARRVGPPAMVIAVVDHAALVRGYAEPAERCVIDGIGPVPVSTIEEMMRDAFLAAVVTDGVDIRSMVHLRRQPTAAQRTALMVRDPTCVIPGCDVTEGLEIDHVRGWVPTRHTTLDELARECPHHHYLKTYEGWVLSGGPGHWKWDPPPGGPRPGPFDDDGLDL
jgi:hypothetical protein